MFTEINNNNIQSLYNLCNRSRLFCWIILVCLLSVYCLFTAIFATSMSDTEEGPPMVPTSHNSTPTTAASPTQAQAVQHLTSGPRDIRTQAFIADSDPDETGRRWKKWKNELLTATVLSVFPLSTLTEYCYCHCVISIPTQYSH